jgi:AcrR family transcriptional regulator
MSPRTEEQFEEIRNEKTKLIMNTALQLFANNGFDTTSISEIAKSANISKGLMYNYFSSKEELLEKIMMSGMKDFMHFLQIKDDENIMREELLLFINGNMTALKQNVDYYKLYFSLAFQPKVSQILHNSFMEIFEEVIKIFAKYFSQKGERKPYVKARFILALFDGIGIHYINDIENFPIDDVNEMIIEMI